MNIFEQLFEEVEIPDLIPVKFHLPVGTIQRKDIKDIIEKSLMDRALLDRIKEGQKVAVAVGSREIPHMDAIAKSVVDLIKEQGAEPFIFPAMGSHGGATAEGQREILRGFGITEETMGVPIKSSMETVRISTTPDGLPVHIDKNANAADCIVPIGRVKPHADFRGKIESGLMKMLTIGCGKQYGANLCHSLGMENMSKNVTAVAKEIIANKNIPFGISIMEDALHALYKLTAVPGEKIEEEEPALLVEAKSMIPGIPFEKVDVLILEEIGKDCSGAGMDPNVTGRSQSLGIWKPFIERIAILNLSEKSHNNGAGVGGGDVTTRRFLDKMNFDITYPNGITSHDLQGIKIPAVMPNDRTAIKMALETCIHADSPLGYRMVWMKNTLHLDSFYISSALVEEAKKNPDIEIVGEPIKVVFDENGNIPGLQ